MKLLLRITACLALLPSTGCEDEIAAAREVAQSCGQQTCPAGTAQIERRSIMGGTDITGGVDPETFSGDGAYARFGNGDCEYICQVINACPQNTFPVITTECFTCGVLNERGEVAQGACRDL